MIDNGNGKSAPVLQSECQGSIDPVLGIRSGVKIDGAFDAKETGNREARTLHDALEAADAVTHLAECLPVLCQFSEPRALFDELQHVLMAAPCRACVRSAHDGILLQGGAGKNQ
jgi:hypothetical protein